MPNVSLCSIIVVIFVPTIPRMNFLSKNEFLLLSLLISSFSLSSAQPGFWFHYCGSNGNYTNTSRFGANLNTFLSSLTSGAQLITGVGNNNFYNLTVGTEPGDDLVAGEAFCRPDMTTSNCNNCCTDAASEIRQVCPTQKEAIGFYRDCAIRYANRPILGTMESSPIFSDANSDNASNPVGFDRELTALLRSLKEKAAAGDRRKSAYGSARVGGLSNSTAVYAWLLCTMDLKGSDCSKCVEDMIDYIPKCCYGKISGAIVTPNCFTRFDVKPFYSEVDDPLSPPLTKQGNSRRTKKLSSLQTSILISIPTFLAISLAIGIWTCHRKRKAMQTANKEIEEVVGAESLQYDLATIKAATHNFSPDNKLGEGGFGEVYKGKLGNGQLIAVKRLSKNSGQGIAEFKTEVVLVAKLQHKNLVKLLGFCVTLKEKLLVYEFLPNSSLDRFLTDPTKNILLDWAMRLKIILGVARGLLYLHEDSRLKVIHRDLKSSNILLDEAMNAKISDFGLAKLFGMDETQGDTDRIVGTYGYMAPEYAVTGHFSVKSDVFSFGVIVLEIVSGQKNRYFTRPQDEEALLYRAWRLWNEKKILDLVDPTLENKYPVDEVTKCIHIGLLSIQDDPIERPRMTSIVAALNGDSISLPDPKAPQFFGNTRRSKNMNAQALGIRIEKLEESNLFSGSKSITRLSPR